VYQITKTHEGYSPGTVVELVTGVVHVDGDIIVRHASAHTVFEVPSAILRKKRNRNASTVAVKNRKARRLEDPIVLARASAYDLSHA
jgi:hypothetical protein